MVSKLSEILSGLFVPDPDPDFLPIPDPGVKKAPDPGYGSAALVFTLLTDRQTWELLEGVVCLLHF